MDKLIIDKCQSVLADNGLIVFQSDTVLGIMARISKDAIRKVNRFKNRRMGKNYSLICSDLSHLKSLVSISNKQLDIIAKNVPGLFTFIIRPKEVFSKELRLIISSEGNLGFRVPTSKLMLKIAADSEFPVLATSANLSGQASVYTLEDLETQVGENIKEIDLVIQSSTKLKIVASTVVDLAGPVVKILRKGSGKLKL